MKYKKSIAICVIIYVTAIFAFVAYERSPKFTINNLDMSPIESIAIYSSSTMERAILTDSDASDLAKLLMDVKITGKGSDDFRNTVDGTWVMFHIKLINQSKFDFSACSPIYIIDSKKGYEGDYEVCNRISELYYMLEEKYFPR